MPLCLMTSTADTGDKDSYEVVKVVFHLIIFNYRDLPEDFNHTSDMDESKIEGIINEKASAKSTSFGHYLN